MGEQVLELLVVPGGHLVHLREKDLDAVEVGLELPLPTGEVEVGKVDGVAIAGGRRIDLRDIVLFGIKIIAKAGGDVTACGLACVKIRDLLQ